MQLEDKIFYFYNDVYEFIEELREKNIIDRKVEGIILTKFSRSFFENLGNKESIRKSYVKEEINIEKYESIPLTEIEGLKNIRISKKVIEDALNKINKKI